ncbi:MtrAB system histidine kinase MtrB [Vallicoccus soli]|uniref:MtrAB system histidine kinase MtrB n=1 Tax=Vallicoccus soli TaxID=2339232 RepID=UPI001C49806B|nr:MtrAB system histidine kinase MtrB [Vallicoccus soli]
MPRPAVWRRSLRLRVVTSTTVLSLVVIAVLGQFLVQRIADGLIDAKVAAGLAEAAAGAGDAQESFSASGAGEPQLVTELAAQVVQRLATSGGPAGLNDVLLVRSPSAADAPPGVAVDLSSCPADAPCEVPERLRERVRATSAQQWTYVTTPAEDGRPVPGLAVGSPVVLPGTAGPYELYYLFPLDQEQETLGLVRRTMLAGGLALVVLVALLAWLVTRQVVSPVQAAARIAERLAAGRLEERMHMRGEDDLARLAASFNRMATNLQGQIRKLEELSRVQRRFVSDVSHELRTPLTTVRMAADVLHDAREDFDPVTRRSAELLQTQLDRFESLLADLLEISRFDAGAASLEPEEVDLRDVAQHVIDASEALAEAKGSDVVLVAPPWPCTAEVDRRRVDRVLRNLVVNAIEHGEGGPVEVHVAQDRDAVAVAVRDHGCGLRPGEAALVFNRFWRADPARARTTGGTGLGLSIALEDAQLHGGWLQAWGEPGDGAQFRLTLPRRAGQELAASPLPLEPPDARRGRGSGVGGPYRRTAGRA